MKILLKTESFIPEIIEQEIAIPIELVSKNYQGCTYAFFFFF